MIRRHRNSDSPTVAVTGLNATDNPGPGISVIRALRYNPDFRGRIIGLAYDSWDPGIYAKDLVDDVFLIPYPSKGTASLRDRLEYIHNEVGLDAIIPTLDSELPSFMSMEADLACRGIGTFMPNQPQFDLRAKTRLPDLGRRAGLDVPATRIITEIEELYTIHKEIPYPLILKGIYYGAHICRSIDEAVSAFYRIAAVWGYPILVQQFHQGEEYDVVAAGDGAGGALGCLPMKKTFLTDKGKAWGGVTVKMPQCIRMAEAFFAATNWRGPCEIEILHAKDGRFFLIEINPRFPAWVYLSAPAGMNLPYMVLQCALGRDVVPVRDYRVGTMFVRISLEQVVSMEEFQSMAVNGEVRRAADPQFSQLQENLSS